MDKKPLQIISRKEWGATEPSTSAKTYDRPWDSVVLSWTTNLSTSDDKNECTRMMRELQADHMAKGEPDICYNFCLCGDGLVYEGRGWHVAHSQQLQYPESYGTTLVVGVFGERRKEFDGSWYGSPAVMLPALQLTKLGYNQKYIKNMLHLYEDHENVIGTVGNSE